MCGFESGCGRVLSSQFGRPLGVPLPLFGVLGFAVLFAGSFFPGRWLRPLALAAGAVGLGLILLQVLIVHEVCPYCLTADLSAVAVAISQLWRREAPPEQGRLPRVLWLVSAVVVVATALMLGPVAAYLEEQARRVPPQVRALWVPGKVNIVEIVDFQCEHCRHMHAIMERLLREENKSGRIHFTFVVVPMPKHAQARDAARAYLCAAAQGKGKEMADELLTAPDLGLVACERMAESLSLSLSKFRACVASAETDRRLDDDLAWVKAASSRGLPVVWIQDRKYSGPQELATLRKAVREVQPAGEAER